MTRPYYWYGFQTVGPAGGAVKFLSTGSVSLFLTQFESITIQKVLMSAYIQLAATASPVDCQLNLQSNLPLYNTMPGQTFAVSSAVAVTLDFPRAMSEINLGMYLLPNTNLQAVFTAYGNFVLNDTVGFDLHIWYSTNN